MDKSDIFTIVIVVLALGFSLYRRYMKKKQGNTSQPSGKEINSSFPSGSRDDDYEPYMKK